MPARRRPMISLSATAGLVELIEAEGADVERILRPLHLDRSRLANRHGFIPTEDFAAILDEAARLTRDDCFGLHFGARFQPKEAGALTYVMLHSPTIGVAIANIARYLHVHNQGAAVTFVRDPPRGFLQHELMGVPPELRRQHAEYSLALGLGTVRLMAGSDWSPVEVQFEHKAPPETAEHIRVFGAPIRFGCAASAVVIDLDFTERQIPAADPRLYPILKAYLDDLPDGLPPEDGFVAAVRRAVGESMGHGEPTLTAVARALALGARTLQRRLTDAETDFTALVNDTRRRFALRYLDDPKHTLTEIAYLLGYSEASAFTRAFKRWTGSTPAERRRVKLGSP